MKVSFELSASDIRYFRERLKMVRPSEGERSERRVMRAATKLIEKAIAAESPEFVRTRLQQLEQLIEMLGDGEWRLEGRDRARILHALAYFVDPDDLIPDKVPGIGYLDDAIMVELVVQDLKHEIGAYRDFCEFRESGRSPSPDKLEQRRTTLQGRMRRRRRRDRETRRSSSIKGGKSLRLW